MILLPSVVKVTGSYVKGLTLEDAREAENIVRSLVRDDLHPNQFTALVSFELTTPKGTLARSNLLRMVNSRCNEQVRAVPVEFTRFTRKNGTVRRSLQNLRKRQAKLFRTPYAVVINNEVKNA